MPRKKLVLQSERPYHIFCKSNNSEWFFVSKPQAWKVFTDFLNYVIECYNFRLHAFVLMSNHYHLLGSTPDCNLPHIMNRLHTEISYAINDIANRKNHVFGTRYRACEIKNLLYLENVIKYIYQNPVEEGLCQRAELYSYSTLSGLYGHSKLNLKVDRMYDEMAFETIDIQYLTNLNQLSGSKEKLLLKKALQKTQLVKIPDINYQPLNFNAANPKK